MVRHTGASGSANEKEATNTRYLDTKGLHNHLAMEG
jgi:hypothetical protein